MSGPCLEFLCMHAVYHRARRDFLVEIRCCWDMIPGSTMQWH